jgi:hypothetical protein
LKNKNKNLPSKIKNKNLQSPSYLNKNITYNNLLILVLNETNKNNLVITNDMKITSPKD